jgi:hypothetical protein
VIHFKFNDNFEGIKSYNKILWTEIKALPINSLDYCFTCVSCINILHAHDINIFLIRI